MYQIPGILKEKTKVFIMLEENRCCITNFLKLYQWANNNNWPQGNFSAYFDEEKEMEMDFEVKFWIGHQNIVESIISCI